MKKLNLEKMRNQRIRQYPLFQVYYFNAEDLVDMDAESFDYVWQDFIERFASRVRRRNFWTKRPFSIVAYQDYNIDFNQHRLIVEERW